VVIYLETFLMLLKAAQDKPPASAPVESVEDRELNYDLDRLRVAVKAVQKHFG
jgi:hypothetical protein